MVELIELPEILKANTFYWRSGISAQKRRYREKKRIEEVTVFFKTLTFEIKAIENGIRAFKDDIELIFTYYETVQNVYKRLTIFKDARKSNITCLKKYRLTRQMKIDHLLRTIA